MEHPNFTDQEIRDILSDIRSIGHEAWKQHEQTVLTHPDTTSEKIRSYSNILEIVNIIFEEKGMSLAVERFIELTEDEKSLLFTLIYMLIDAPSPSSDDDECDCPNCTLVRNIDIDSRDRYFRQKEISDNRIYPISETIFNEMNREIIRYKSLLTRLKMTLSLLSENDERYLFAMQLLLDEEDVF